MLEIKFILVAGIAYVYDNFGMETNMNFASFAASSTTSAIITYSYDRMAELSKAPNTLQSPRLSGAAGRLTSPALFPPPSADNATYYYQIDGNKNVTELTDASGAVVAHYEYSPFGSVVTATGTYAEDNPFRFSSEYYDPESSLVYYNYRYYSPTLGRWLKPDPIMEKGGYNLYAMVNNSCIDFNDLLGLANGNWGKLADSMGVTPEYAEQQYAVGEYYNKTGINPLEVHNTAFDGSTAISISFLLINHEIVNVGNGCKQYCIALVTSVIGISASGTISDSLSPLSLYVGIDKNLSISGGDGSVGISGGWGVGSPIGGTIRLICVQLNDTDNNGCPCPETNNDNSTFIGMFAN